MNNDSYVLAAWPYTAGAEQRESYGSMKKNRKQKEEDYHEENL